MNRSRVSGLIFGAAVVLASALIVSLNLLPKLSGKSEASASAGAASGGSATSSALGASKAPTSGAPASDGSSPSSGAPGARGPGGPGGAGGASRRGAATAIIVDTARAELGSLSSVAKLTGEVQAVRSLKAYPDTSGRLVETVAAGTRVAVGDVVARVDPSKPGSRFEPSPVRAPLAGSVVSVLLEAGANVTTSSAIVEIATLSDLDVVVRVPERWAAGVSVGTVGEVRLTALPGRRFPARVRSADPVIDPVSRSKRVLLRLSGDLSQVEPGMFAEVSITLSRSSSALVIPLESVVRRGGTDFVYVVADGIAHERVVSLGLFSETGAEVLGGVSRGEVVVVRGQNLIREGSRVQAAAGSL